MGHKYVKEEDTFNTLSNGTVPKPTAQEVTDNKYLRADGTWKNPPGGGGGSSVTITPTLSSGTKIADFEIDGNAGELYAPSGGSSGDTYSTAEQVVGTWIDGKPVYEKTYNDTFSANATTLAFSLVSNTFRIISVTGFIVPSDVPTNTVYLNTKSGLIWIDNVNSSSVEIKRGNGAYFGSSPEAFVVIRYTKITD